MFYYDYTYFNNFKFYIVIKNETIFHLGLELPSYSNLIHDPNKLLPYINWLNNYFKGIINKHNFKLNKPLSSFDNLVYEELVKVKPGSTISYKELAYRINKPKAARAIGNALSRNEILILIPCHRIIKSDGSLGGFAEGPILKDLLLSLEK